ncbi:MAG: hypothetical protein N2323_00415 [candidate division WOR-3 bacterium]|nr:hypothetical protein [candidate division WOR-3 bacterium]MDW8114553.1 hypothetical protein [candidate division WOR-3 bacterium]
MKQIILTLISFFISSIFLINFQTHQKIGFYDRNFLKENNTLNKEFFLLKEVAINLEKFRLFFEPIYLEKIKNLIRESRILKDTISDSLINRLTLLTFSSKSKIKKDDLIIFINFREWLKEKEKSLKKEITKLEINYETFKKKKIRELNFINLIGIGGLFVLIILINIFLPWAKKKKKIFNDYFSLLEVLKIVKEKTNKYLEKIDVLENRLKEIWKPLSSENLENLKLLRDYKKNLTYSLLNLQLGLLQNDQLLVKKYFINFTEISEKIINLLSLDEREKLITYLKESEEELSVFKEDLINFKKIISETKNYETKNDY